MKKLFMTLLLCCGIILSCSTIECAQQKRSREVASLIGALKGVAIGMPLGFAAFFTIKNEIIQQVVGRLAVSLPTVFFTLKAQAQWDKNQKLLEEEEKQSGSVQQPKHQRHNNCRFN